MGEIVLATRNKDKIKEIKEILQGLAVQFLSLDDFPRAPCIEEDGRTFEENAIKKATVISRYTCKFALADDSGLEVEALGGRPGIYSSRYAGEKSTYAENNRKLLSELSLIKGKKRRACFRCVMVLASPRGEVRTTEGRIDGTIAEELRGESGFGYDPLFIVPSYNKTFAELGPEIKNRISHRALALKKIREILLHDFLSGSLL